MTDRLRLGVIFGGASVEHTISVRSARAVMGAAGGERFDVVLFAVTRRGVWLTPDESQNALAAIEAGGAEQISDSRDGSESIMPAQTLEALLGCDIAFPLIHGTTGEDGVLQGFLEMLGLPYVGPGVGASAAAMDKALCKQILTGCGIPVAPGIALTQEEWRRDPQAAERAAAAVGYPQFVKPASGGSSIGISRVQSREDLSDAFAAAFACDATMLIERAMANPREIECGLLGGAALPDGGASVLGEIRTGREFYDYEAKYEDPATELIVPADLDAAAAERMRRIAREAYTAIGCYGMARADFLLSPDGEIWLGEINTIPGFTSASMYPLLWEASGVPFRDLVSRLVDLALERAA